MKIYTYKNCSTCRKAAKWLRENGIEDFQEIPIRETPPSVKELKSMLEFLSGDMRRLFNTSGGDYRELGLKDRLPGMPEKEALALLASNGNLIKRPFLMTKEKGLVGFKEQEWSAALLS